MTGNIITSANSPFFISSGVTSNFDIVSSGGTEVVLSGGVARQTGVEGGGVLVIENGGSGDAATLTGVTGSGSGNFATEIVSQGGIVTNMNVSSGGILVVSAGGFAASTTVISTGFGASAGGLVLSGGTASATLVTNDGQEAVFSGGTDIAGTITSGAAGAAVVVSSGGFDVGATINSVGVLLVLSGGTARGATVGEAGILDVGFAAAGGLAINTDVQSSGELDVSLQPAATDGRADVGAAGRNEFQPAAVEGGGAGKAKEMLITVVATATPPLDTNNAPPLRTKVWETRPPDTCSMATELIVKSLPESVAEIPMPPADTFSGGSASSTVVGSGGLENIFTGAIDQGGTIASAGVLKLFGGTASGATVSGLLLVSSGVVVSANLKSGGTENAAATGGALTVSDGRHTAAVALLGNYIAGSFVIAADGHGGTLVTEAQTGTAPLLTRPRAQFCRPHSRRRCAGRGRRGRRAARPALTPGRRAPISASSSKPVR
jgi:autotransporter passenger strand-loop-strand repeat protein